MSAAGVISGTPTTAGTRNFSARVTDGAPVSTTKPLSIVVNPPPVITTTSLPAATVGVPYSTTLQASGGIPPYVWSVASGALPAGLVLSPDGVISGTPTTVGPSTFTIRVDDPGAVALRSLTLSVNPVVTTPLVTLTASNVAPRKHAWVKLSAHVDPRPGGYYAVVLVDVTHFGWPERVCGSVTTCDAWVREGRGAHTYKALVVDLGRRHFGRVIATSTPVTVAWH